MQHHKITGRARDSLQFRHDAIMISFVVILSFATRAICSLSVQGSLSTPDDDTVSIDLFANKLSDGVDELIGRLHATKRIYVTIDLGGKIINVHQTMLETKDRINYYQNYLVLTFNKATTLLNIAESEIMSHPIKHEADYAPSGKSNLTTANIGGIILKKIYCEDFQDDFIKSLMTGICGINIISSRKSKSSKDENNDKTLRYDTIIGNQIAPRMETRILRHSTLMTDSSDINSKGSFATGKINPIDREHKTDVPAAITNNLINGDSAFQTLRDKRLLTVGTVSVNRQSISKKQNLKERKFNNDALVTKFNDSENRFRLSKDVSVSSSGKDMTHDKQEETDTTSPKSLQRNITNVSRIFSRRMFQTPVFRSKDPDVHQSHVSRIKMDKTSAMDEILEAVRQILPTEEPVEMPSKESQMISGMSDGTQYI